MQLKYTHSHYVCEEYCAMGNGPAPSGESWLYALYHAHGLVLISRCHRVKFFGSPLKYFLHVNLMCFKNSGSWGPAPLSGRPSHHQNLSTGSSSSSCS